MHKQLICMKPVDEAGYFRGKKGLIKLNQIIEEKIKSKNGTNLLNAPHYGDAGWAWFFLCDVKVHRFKPP